MVFIDGYFCGSVYGLPIVPHSIIILSGVRCGSTLVAAAVGGSVRHAYAPAGDAAADEAIVPGSAPGAEPPIESMVTPGPRAKPPGKQ